MADDISKKISIDVAVNTDGHQQVDQYKASFDSLRTSISNLGKPLADLSKSISSLDNDLAQLAASHEKTAAKMADASKKAADQQTKTLASSNQNLKKHLSEAAQMKEDAYQKDLELKFRSYGAAGAIENKQYAQQKKDLETLLKKKLMDQSTYNTAAEQLLKEHQARIGQIMDQYRNDDGGGQAALTAKGTNAIDTPALSTTVMKAIPTMQLPVPKDSLVKKLFSNILGYYKNTKNAESQVSAATDAKTNAATAASIKTADDKKLASAVANAQKIEDSVFTIVTKGIQKRSDAKVAALEADKTNELNNTSLTSAQKQAITDKYKKLEDQVKLKAFKEQQEMSIAQALINGAIAVTKTEADLGPIAGTIAIAAVIANTAAQVATISAQKPPAMAKGGYFKSDGKGAVLPGYSRTDNTNAYLRSGEAVVVSEAMRDPWARNLVSAINVAYGGRDFSITNPAKGYAVGGIFTDGGNANRYYNQPMNDQKNLANTIAYQMINNFPPVYVDVKDVNNQQNILAQTVNRVNL
jgi:hypothetical protein